MPTVRIFPFETYDGTTDTMVRSRRWGTREAVEQIAHGMVIEEDAVEVPRHLLDTDIPGMTRVGFDPRMVGADVQWAVLTQPERAGTEVVDVTKLAPPL